MHTSKRSKLACEQSLWPTSSDFIHILQCFTKSSVKWKLIRRNLKTFNFPTREKTNFGRNKHQDQTQQLSCFNYVDYSVLWLCFVCCRLCKCSLWVWSNWHCFAPRHYSHVKKISYIAKSTIPIENFHRPALWKINAWK